MPIKVSDTQARANLATLLDSVTNDGATVIIRRPGRPDVALIAADELAGLIETVRLPTPPENGIRLLTATRRASEGGGSAMSLDQLRREVGLAPE